MSSYCIITYCIYILTLARSQRVNEASSIAPALQSFYILLARAHLSQLRCHYTAVMDSCRIVLDVPLAFCRALDRATRRLWRTERFC